MNSLTLPTVNDTYTYDGHGLQTSRTHNGSAINLAWDNSKAVPLLLDDGQASVIYGPGGIPVEQVDRNNSPLYFHHDQQGSTTLLTDSSGASAGTASYFAYGTATRTGTTTPFGYDGQYTDPDSGLINLRARQYDAGTAQFVTRDPLDKLTRQAYSYVNGNPLNLADPTGLGCGITDPGGCINDAVGAAASVSGPVSLVTGGLALILLPTPLSPVLGGISAGAGGISSVHQFASGNSVACLLDAAGTAFGGAGFVSGLNASASKAASALARTELGAASATAQSEAELAAWGNLVAEYQASRLAARAYGAQAASFGLDAFGFGLGSTISSAYAALCIAAG